MKVIKVLIPIPTFLQYAMAKFYAVGILCYLVHTTLGTAPPFQALSYTWGDLRDTKEIGVLFNVGTISQDSDVPAEVVSRWDEIAKARFRTHDA